jgi:hypothetical protein
MHPLHALEVGAGERLIIGRDASPRVGRGREEPGDRGRRQIELGVVGQEHRDVSRVSRGHATALVTSEGMPEERGG